MNCRVVAIAGVVASVASLLPMPAAASDALPQAARWMLVPADLLTRPYVADPFQPRFRASVVSVFDSAIADSGDERFDLALGGRFGLVRLTPRERPDRPWQLDIEAGFVGQFDLENSLDNLGWDGLYGLTLDKRLAESMMLKMAIKHYSSHVGDELMERTGRRRINYTREETIIGLSWRPVEAWRVYGEAAWGYEIRTPELQDPGRVQAGIEFDARRRLPSGVSWYGACDLGSFEESDWKIDVTVQLGLSRLSGEKTWRLGLELRDGRPPIGEFFQDRERWIGLGLWLDPWRG